MPIVFTITLDVPEYIFIATMAAAFLAKSCLRFVSTQSSIAWLMPSSITRECLRDFTLAAPSSEYKLTLELDYSNAITPVNGPMNVEYGEDNDEDLGADIDSASSTGPMNVEYGEDNDDHLGADIDSASSTSSETIDPR